VVGWAGVSFHCSGLECVTIGDSAPVRDSIATSCRASATTSSPSWAVAMQAAATATTTVTSTNFVIVEKSDFQVNDL